MEDYAAIAAGAKAYLKTLIFFSKDEFGNFVDEYSEEDASEETLAFVAGEAYAVARFVRRHLAKTKRGVLNPEYLMKKVCEQLVIRAAGEIFCSVSTADNSFFADDFETLWSWYVERLYEGKLVMYAGDDHKLYVDGFEWEREVTLVGTVEDPLGVEKSFLHLTSAVSRSAAQLKHLVGATETGLTVKICKERGNANLYTGARTCQGSLAEVG